MDYEFIVYNNCSLYFKLKDKMDYNNILYLYNIMMIDTKIMLFVTRIF